MIQVDGSDINMHIDQAAEVIVDPSQNRVTFKTGGVVWALRFPNVETFK